VKREAWFLCFGLAVLPGIAGRSGLAGQTFRQTQSDDYTRYELQAPGSARFRILYEVSATAAGAPFYLNTIRQGAEEEVHGVRDLTTGKALEWRIVSGGEAREMGMQNANPGARYIAVRLARQVPPGGQARIRIDKTYRDTASYRARGDRIVFERSLGIDRNALVLPAGYELILCNFPSQVAREADGRIRVSFMNAGPAAVPLRLEARRLRARSVVESAHARERGVTGAGAEAVAVRESDTARTGYRFGERAYENRDITYHLDQPETHSFRLFHDYTETRPGTDRYVNVVRPGSRAANPEATILDTGEKLKVETLRGEEIARQGIDIGGVVTAESEIVLIRFDPVPEGGSVRLRIEETYTDPGRYVLDGDELVWDRALGRPRNTVVLPAGWYLTASSIPAVVTETEDGRIRLRFINDRPGEIQVLIRGARR